MQLRTTITMAIILSGSSVTSAYDWEIVGNVDNRKSPTPQQTNQLEVSYLWNQTSPNSSSPLSEIEFTERLSKSTIQVSKKTSEGVTPYDFHSENITIGTKLRSSNSNNTFSFSFSHSKAVQDLAIYFEHLPPEYTRDALPHLGKIFQDIVLMRQLEKGLKNRIFPGLAVEESFGSFRLSAEPYVSTKRIRNTKSVKIGYGRYLSQYSTIEVHTGQENLEIEKFYNLESTQSKNVQTGTTRNSSISYKTLWNLKKNQWVGLHLDATLKQTDAYLGGLNTFAIPEDYKSRSFHYSAQALYSPNHKTTIDITSEFNEEADYIRLSGTHFFRDTLYSKVEFNHEFHSSSGLEVTPDWWSLSVGIRY